MLTALLGPKSVSEIQVGPAGAVVRKSVVFQTPPRGAGRVDSVARLGRTDRPPGRVTRPEVAAGAGRCRLRRLPPIDAGPTGVQASPEIARRPDQGEEPEARVDIIGSRARPGPRSEPASGS